MTPDPYRGSGRPSSPQSWNRYAYALGDPANTNDPTGLDGGQGTVYDGITSAACEIYDIDDFCQTLYQDTQVGSVVGNGAYTDDDIYSYYCTDATTGQTTPCTLSDGSDNPNAVQTGFVSNGADTSTTVASGTSTSTATGSPDSTQTAVAAWTPGLAPGNNGPMQAYKQFTNQPAYPQPQTPIVDSPTTPNNPIPGNPAPENIGRLWVADAFEEMAHGLHALETFRLPTSLPIFYIPLPNPYHPGPNPDRIY